jgi:leucyl aminopeptidase
MEFSVKTGHAEKQKTHCIVTGVFETRTPSMSTQQLNDASAGYLTELLMSGDLDGKLGETLLVAKVPKLLCDRVLLIGCGRLDALEDKEFRDITKKAFKAVQNTAATEIIFCLTEIPVKNRDLRWKIRHATEIAIDCGYLFDDYKTKKNKDLKTLRRVTFMLPSRRDISMAEKAVLEGQAIANAMAFTKDLANQPPNICTPVYLGKQAEKLASAFSTVNAAVLNEKEIAALKMGSFLSVAQGSKNPPRLITLEYRGRKDKQKPIVLVGKGVTFDTGGNSLKTGVGMIGMKYDMCGAATVLAVLRAAATLELPLNMVAIVPATENMPGNTATRPEDVVTSMSGLTIEILNTDAEGRLILCDALTYAERFDPEVVIDVATLTGACIMTFSSHASALLSNNDALANDLYEAGQQSLDKCWQLPLWDEYQEALNSPYADIANIGTPSEAGTILGACFLARFTKKYPWAHLDVAGTASRGGKDRAATGRPVHLLMQYLLNRCQKSS